MSNPQDTMPAAPQPSQGGSYTRDPVTGELTLSHRTLTPDEAAAQAQAPQPE